MYTTKKKLQKAVDALNEICGASKHRHDMSKPLYQVGNVLHSPTNKGTWYTEKTTLGWELRRYIGSKGSFKIEDTQKTKHAMLATVREYADILKAVG